MCKRPLQLFQQVGHRLEQCFVEEVQRPEDLLGHSGLGKAELAGQPEQLDFVLKSVDQSLTLSWGPTRRFKIHQPAVNPAVLLQYGDALGFGWVSGDDRPNTQDLEQRTNFFRGDSRLRSTGDDLGE